MLRQVLFKRTGISKFCIATHSSSVAFCTKTPSQDRMKGCRVLGSLNRPLELKQKRILSPQSNALFTGEQHLQWRSFIWSNQEANKVYVLPNSHFTVIVTYHSSKLRNQKKQQKTTRTVDRSASDWPSVLQDLIKIPLLVSNFNKKAAADHPHSSPQASLSTKLFLFLWEPSLRTFSLMQSQTHSKTFKI